jgi:hypothetical protein
VTKSVHQRSGGASAQCAYAATTPAALLVGVGGPRFGTRRVGLLQRGDPPVPLADEMLANKLLLETDERRFLATAHRHRHR